MTRDAHSGKQRLRDEAAAWFALMRGPQAAQRRGEFEAWLAADAVHRDAYNRIGETFALGKALKQGPWGYARVEAVEVSRRSRRKMLGTVILAGCLGFGILATTTLTMQMISGGGMVGSGARTVDHRDLVTARGEIRTFTLADGSRVTLDTDSRVRVWLSRDRRDLQLVRGRGRFAVAHERRPFVVRAAGGLVVARGTLFDITLDSRRGAIVDLIEGVVDVRALGRSGNPRVSDEGATNVTLLVAGHSLAFGAGDGSPTSLPYTRIDWPAGLRDFQSIRLGALVADANRYGASPIVLASDDLADLRVSGTFGIRDTRRLAANLADLLDLTVHEDGRSIVLARH